MTLKLSILAPAFLVLISAGASIAGSHEGSEACTSMLAVAVGQQLEAEGIDVSNACELSVSDLATIKNLLETDGMGARVQIEQVLADAGK